MANKNQYFPQTVSHPGETLDEKLEEMNMGPKEFAVRTAKPEKTIIAIIKGESSITADMAVLFESVTKIPAHFWLNSQRAFDEYVARNKREEMIAQSVEWARGFPLSTMIKEGWLATTSSSNIKEKTTALLSFFSFSTPEAWQNYYCNQMLKVGFRISLKNTKAPYAISAWLRKGELQATEIEAPAYSEKTFKEVLPKIKSVMATHPSDFFSQLQLLCLEAGVKVVFTPCLPKAPINGSTRWLNDTPLIQLTDRYKRNDVFWFTFFHEAGHILLHGKKEIFLENIDYPDKITKKEIEADIFAEKWTFSVEEEKEVMEATPLDISKIRNFAKKFNTHPAIIIGRFQHNKLLPFSVGRELIVPIKIEHEIEN
ncbi:MAG: ImmA/IrrE family metallo-endopeptidase [Dysgonamonadaceae bacterium]|nr:ImmA/IrrE family metallo-endopeptidase [Dysgonamonadaceae bacterium]MDD4727707.1 ImmA/IrrE family metallo-endopeptidase [Dysgonamonadaceae bacterium]